MGNRRSVSLAQVASWSLLSVFNHWQFDSVENWTALYSDQVPPLTTNLGFPSLSLVQVGRFFHRQYLWSSGFPPTFPHYVLEVFYRLIPLSGFPPQSPTTRLGGFSPATWSSFETHPLPYGARMFSLVTRFSSSVSHHLGWEVFLQVPIPGSHSRFPLKLSFNRFHAQRSLRLKREAIVIT